MNYNYDFDAFNTDVIDDILYGSSSQESREDSDDEETNN